MKRVITMLGAVLFGAVAAASPNQADAQADEIWACVNNSSGTIKIVSPGAFCTGNDIPLIWNAVGHEGPEGPQGPQGEPGPKGDTGPQGPPGVGGGAAAAMQFVGLSDPISPASGVLGLSGKCQAMFGPGYRLCTSEEIIKTVEAPSIDPPEPVYAHVQPTFVPSNTAQAVDISGQSAPNAGFLTCNGWNQTPFGLTNLVAIFVASVVGGVKQASFVLRQCEIAPATCCGPPLPTP